jgi:hypothetical protein
MAKSIPLFQYLPVIENSFTWSGRILNDPEHDLTAGYLAIDIQQSPQWTAELLEKIAAIQSGQISSWERIGNAYCLRLYPDHVEIEEDYDEVPGELVKIPIAVFETAVKSWQTHILK